jgi:hypothetical protein
MDMKANTTRDPQNSIVNIALVVQGAIERATVVLKKMFERGRGITE